MNIFKVIGHWFVSTFEHIFGSDQAKNFLHASEELLKTAVGQLAIEAVQEAAATLASASGPDKHAFAVDKLKASAEAKGINIGLSMLNLLVELAYNAGVKQS